jgi:hypothetical protein
MTRQMPFEPLPASVLFAFVLSLVSFMEISIGYYHEA